MPRAIPTRSAVVVTVALAALLAGCQEKQEAAAEKPAPVVAVRTVHTVSMAETRSYTGTIQPRHLVGEGFRVGGKVVERSVDVGDRVTAGDVLARLDPTDLDLAVGQAEAAVAAARSNLARVTAEEGRTRDLLAKGHASQADYDGRKLALDEAAARLATAEKQLALARNQSTYGTLVATADGVVTATAVEAGQVVAAGTPVVSIARAGAMEIQVAIPESRLGDLAGAHAAVTLWSGDTVHPATLREVSPQADPATRTYAARFAIDASDAEVRFGMTATLTLTKGDPRPVVMVPATAVLDEGRGPVVFTVDRETARLAKRPVEIARYETAAVVVTGGLTAGETIVTLGVNKLEDGATVRLQAVN